MARRTRQGARPSPDPQTAKRQNVGDIDIEDPNAVRQLGRPANRILGVLKVTLKFAFRKGTCALPIAP
jgi:hypothetical protein